jgi:hypothetical protein
MAEVLLKRIQIKISSWPNGSWGFYLSPWCYTEKDDDISPYIERSFIVTWIRLA